MVHVNAGKLTHYPGGYQYYLDKTKALSERAALTAGGLVGNAASKPEARPSAPGSAASRKDQKRLEAEERQAKSRERKSRQAVVEKLETEILHLETRQAEIVAELENAATYEKPGLPAQLNRELVDIQHRLAEITPKWEQAATRLAELDA